MTFDFVGVGGTSAPQTTTVTNRGTAPLVIGQVLLGGRDAKDFKISGDSCANQTIAPAATCAVSVVFSPTASGTRVAWLRFTDNDACYDWINIAGSGTGAAATAAVAHAAAACQVTVTQTVTTPGPGTTSTTTTPGSANVGASSAITFPKTCSSRRTVTVGLKAPSGKTFKVVKVLLRGKTVKTLKGKAIRAKVALKGLPRGRFTVEVRATTTDGQKIVRKHYYVTCVTAKS